MTATPDAKNSCWDHNTDPVRVSEALQFVLQVEELPSDTPMFATGASQGGYFMWDLQANMAKQNLKCIAPQVAEIKKKSFHEHLPTMMIYMPLRDHGCNKTYKDNKGVEKPCQENIVPKIRSD